MGNGDHIQKSYLAMKQPEERNNLQNGSHHLQSVHLSRLLWRACKGVPKSRLGASSGIGFFSCYQNKNTGEKQLKGEGLFLLAVLRDKSVMVWKVWQADAVAGPIQSGSRGCSVLVLR